MLLCDTGVLLAAGNVKDNHHAACLSLMRAAEGPLLVPSPVLGEIGYLLQSRVGGRQDAARGGDQNAPHVFDHPGLRVSAASPHLGLTSTADVLAVCTAVFPDEPVPDRSRLILDDLFDEG